MDWLAIIEQLGGGLSAVVIAALGFAVWRLAKALFQSYEQRISREREHAQELMRTIETVRALNRGSE